MPGLDGDITQFTSPSTDASTILGRLLILRELLEGQTDQDQKSYCTCLWHSARSEPRFLNAGLIVYPGRLGYIASNAIDFFRMKNRDLFSEATIAQKRELLDSLIRVEKEKSTDALRAAAQHSRAEI